MFRSLARPEVLCNLCCLGVASLGEEKIRFSILSNAMNEEQLQAVREEGRESEKER